MKYVSIALSLCLMAILPCVATAATSACNQAIQQAAPAKREMLAKLDSYISKGAFYAFAAEKGTPECTVKIDDDTATLAYRFLPSGNQLTVDEVESIETFVQTLTVNGLSEKEAKQILEKDGKRDLEGCVNWSKPEKDNEDTVYSGDVCNCMGRIVRKAGVIMELTVSHAC